AAAGIAAAAWATGEGGGAGGGVGAAAEVAATGAGAGGVGAGAGAAAAGATTATVGVPPERRSCRPQTNQQAVRVRALQMSGATSARPKAFIRTREKGPTVSSSARLIISG